VLITGVHRLLATPCFAALNTGVDEIRLFSRDEKNQRIHAEGVREPELSSTSVMSSTAQSTAGIPGCATMLPLGPAQQVAVVEFHPMEAVRTNVMGAENVIDAACTWHANG